MQVGVSMRQAAQCYVDNVKRSSLFQVSMLRLAHIVRFISFIAHANTPMEKAHAGDMLDACADGNYPIVIE